MASNSNKTSHNQISFDNTTITAIDINNSYITMQEAISPEQVIIKGNDGGVIFEGDVRLNKNDEPLHRRLERLERVVGITPRSPTLEAQYPELREAGERMDRAIGHLNARLEKTISSIVDEYNDFADQCEVMEKLKSNNGETD